MTKKYLFGAAAGIALLAAGAAQAADVPQITAVAVTPTAAPVAAGPTFNVEIIKLLEWDWYGPVELWTTLEYDVDIELPSGLGITFFGGLDDSFGFPITPYYWLHAGVYKSFGNATVGGYVGVHGEIPGGVDYFELGFDVEYESGPLYVYADTWFEFEAPVVVDTDIVVEFSINEALTLGTEINLEFDAGLDIETEVWLAYNLGILTPYVIAYWEPGDLDFGIGTDIEVPLGTGPFTLIGNAEVGFDFGGFNYVYGNVGIRYNR